MVSKLLPELWKFEDFAKKWLKSKKCKTRGLTNYFFDQMEASRSEIDKVLKSDSTEGLFIMYCYFSYQNKPFEFPKVIEVCRYYTSDYDKMVRLARGFGEETKLFYVINNNIGHEHYLDTLKIF